MEAATQSHRLLATWFGPDEVEQLVLGPTFHAFSAGWMIAVAGTVRRLDHELEQRVLVLGGAIDQLEREARLWLYDKPEGTFADDRLHALVLDTGALEEHPSAEELGGLAPQWLHRSGNQAGGIAIAFAAVTLDEIDRHKTVTTKMHGGSKLIKTEARRAQRLVAELFPIGVGRAEVATPFHQVYAVLQARPLNHEPLPIADNEIISYALDLKPCAALVTFVSYDLGPVITAQQQGLKSLRLEYPPST